jgi:predicted enzyme related to lactoylglutathione lyase
MTKVTGIGGIFIKANDAKALAAWYDKYLGVPFGENLYVDYKWTNENNPDVAGHTVFSFFKEESNYFTPSQSRFMINFRVKDFNALLDNLRNEGIWVDDKIEEYEYGKFGWIMDVEGNKIELWEPVDEKL